MAAMRILVVGGGIAGLATARALAGAGFSVELVEREAESGSERARASTCPGTRPAPSARSASSERCWRERP
jgi:flavin-dependent dehydrogenase